MTSGTTAMLRIVSDLKAAARSVGPVGARAAVRAPLGLSVRPSAAGGTGPHPSAAPLGSRRRQGASPARGRSAAVAVAASLPASVAVAVVPSGCLRPSLPGGRRSRSGRRGGRSVGLERPRRPQRVSSRAGVAVASSNSGCGIQLRLRYTTPVAQYNPGGGGRRAAGGLHPNFVGLPPSSSWSKRWWPNGSPRLSGWPERHASPTSPFPARKARQAPSLRAKPAKPRRYSTPERRK
jgi:hypothetical protein